MTRRDGRGPEPAACSRLVPDMAAGGGPFTVAWLRPGDRLVLDCPCGAATALARADLVRQVGADVPLALLCMLSERRMVRVDG